MFDERRVRAEHLSGCDDVRPDECWAETRGRLSFPWSSALISLARVGVPVEALWGILSKLAGAEALDKGMPTAGRASVALPPRGRCLAVSVVWADRLFVDTPSMIGQRARIRGRL